MAGSKTKTEEQKAKTKTNHCQDTLNQNLEFQTTLINAHCRILQSKETLLYIDSKPLEVKYNKIFLLDMMRLML